MVDMLLTGFDAPVEQVLYLDRALREHGLLQAIARVNRRFSHRRDGVETEKTHGLVVDYHGVSRDLDDALSSFDRTDVQDTMQEMDEDSGAGCRGGGLSRPSHISRAGTSPILGRASASSRRTLPRRATSSPDLFERFNADYSRFSRLMDRFLPDPPRAGTTRNG